MTLLNYFSQRVISASWNHMNILVVDDDREVRLLIRMAINDCEGAQVVGEARNGEEAVREVMRLQPDVVIMDVKMPVMDGIEATRRVKQLAPNTTVVAFSSIEDPKINAELKKAGASKNFGRDQLDAMLDHLGCAS
jgi:chemotaxis response regulator CheB